MGFARRSAGMSLVLSPYGLLEWLRGLARRLLTAAVTVHYVAILLIAAGPAVYLGINNVGAFTSPDETVQYMAAESLARDGRLYIEDEVTRLNTDAPTGPRAFVQHNGRSVPIYSLGYPLLTGIVHAAFGRTAPIVLAFMIPGLLVVLLTGLVRVLYPRAPVYIGLAFLGITPLWFWSSRVYRDIGLTYVFVAGGLLMAALAVRHQSLKWFFFASLALGMAALVRNPEAAFLLIIGLALTVLFVRLEPFSWRRTIKVSIAYAGGQMLGFVIPVMLLNWWTYGAPLTFGQSLLYALEYPDRLPSSSGIFALGFNYLYLAFFPNPTDFGVLWNGLRFQVLLLVPLITTLGIAGAFLTSKSLARHFGYVGILLLEAAVLYVLFTRTNPGTFMALTTEPDLRASLVRYWMPLYLALGLGAAILLARAPQSIAIAVIAAMVVTSAYQVWYGTPHSVIRLQQIIDNDSSRYEQLLLTTTEPEALIIAGSTFDKWTAPYRRTIGLWRESTPDRMAQLAETATLVHQQGRPVYFIFGPNEPPDSVAIVERHLAPAFLGLESVARPSFTGELWKVVPRQSPLSFEPARDGFQGEFSAPGTPFVLGVLHDGVTENLIGNPSFEVGLEGWTGPDFGARARRSTSEALFGEYSLRMELSGDDAPGERIRRTFTVPLDARSDESWSARARVLITDIHGAEVVLRIFMQDAQGQNLANPMTTVSRLTEGFQTIAIPEVPVPVGATSVQVQMALHQLAPGARAVVYWDGVELAPGKLVAGDYCDGDQMGCVWTGEPHRSPSLRADGIRSITVQASTGTAVLEGPFVPGDQVLFQNGAVYHLTPGTTVPKQITAFSVPEHGRVDLYISADGLPELTILPIELEIEGLN